MDLRLAVKLLTNDFNICLTAQAQADAQNVIGAMERKVPSRPNHARVNTFGRPALEGVENGGSCLSSCKTRLTYCYLK